MPQSNEHSQPKRDFVRKAHPPSLLPREVYAREAYLAGESMTEDNLMLEEGASSDLLSTDSRKSYRGSLSTQNDLRATDMTTPEFLQNLQPSSPPQDRMEHPSVRFSPASEQIFPEEPAKLRDKQKTQDKEPRNIHWLLPLGVGMLAMIVLWVVSSSVLAWGKTLYDDVQYGRPRTSQTDAIVGHGGDSRAHPSHFMAINLNRQAIIVEFMAGNPANSVSYLVPSYILGDNADLTPITLQFRDVTGDGKPDMIVQMQLRSGMQTFIFVNDSTKFRPPTSSDSIHL